MDRESDTLAVAGHFPHLPAQQREPKPNGVGYARPVTGTRVPVTPYRRPPAPVDEDDYSPPKRPVD